MVEHQEIRLRARGGMEKPVIRPQLETLGSVLVGLRGNMAVVSSEGPPGGFGQQSGLLDDTDS